MKRIFLPTPSPSHWQRVLADPVKHWKPGFSAMTEAACWENEADRLPSGIAKLLESSQEPQLTGLRLLAAFPEWAVELPGGDTPSCTDVLALAANEHGLVVIGVEAKVDEPFGPTLGEKRATGTSSGQLQSAYSTETDQAFHTHADQPFHVMPIRSERSDALGFPS